ncbi:MAG: hypothetical protein LBS41_04680 [Streptococcaceae bacterium]|nr:hypothetical protein [Streptococcaceae bacterium]
MKLTNPYSRLIETVATTSHSHSVDVGANWRLIFEAYDENEQLTTDEGQAKLLSIVSGEDYH